MGSPIRQVPGAIATGTTLERACGAQVYRRKASGNVEFEELKWEEPSIEFRFVRGNVEQKDNVFGMPAGCKNGDIN